MYTSVNKSQAIKLLQAEGWTKKDAERALAVINFNTNNIDELTIRRAISPFAGSELINRQRLQAAQKRLVTKKTKEIEQKEEEYAAQIHRYKKNQQQEWVNYEAEIQSLTFKNDALEAKYKILVSENNQLTKANEQLKKDNKILKNLVDEIKLQLAMNTKKLLQYEDSEIRKELVKLFKWTLG